MSGKPNEFRPYYDSSWITQNTSSDASMSTAKRFGGSLPDITSGIREVSESDTFSNLKDQASDTLNNLGRRFLTVFMAHPFEVAKTILQTEFIPIEGTNHSEDSTGYSTETTNTSDEEDNEDANYDNFFERDDDNDSTSLYDPLNSSKDKKLAVDKEGYVQLTASEVISPRKLYPYSIRNTLSNLRAQEGIRGFWRGLFGTYVYGIASTSMEAWLSSLSQALFSLPDPAIIDFYDTSQSLAALCVSLACSSITALILSPMDIARVRSILLKSKKKNSSYWSLLKQQKLWFCPSNLIAPTILHSTLPQLFSSIIPVSLKYCCGVGFDPYSWPSLYYFSSFVSSIVQLSVRLPLETILKTAQASVCPQDTYVVPVRRYCGILETAWSATTQERNDSWGCESLYRGWKVGVWGIIGQWSLQASLALQDDNVEEF